MLVLIIMCFLLLIAGFALFVIGLVKAIKSKFTCIDSLIWLYSGNILVLISGFIAKGLNI
jgi:hypothetical protein